MTKLWDFIKLVASCIIPVSIILLVILGIPYCTYKMKTAPDLCYATKSKYIYTTSTGAVQAWYFATDYVIKDNHVEITKSDGEKIKSSSWVIEQNDRYSPSAECR